MKYNKLDTFNSALKYFNHVGIIPCNRNLPNWITSYQSQLYNLIDMVENYYQVNFPLKNYPYYDVPLQVKFIRSKNMLLIKLTDNTIESINLNKVKL